MSFASNVKDELCTVACGESAQHAELYGLLLFGRSLSCSAVSLQTEHAGVALRVQSLLRSLYGAEAAVRAAGRSDGRRFRILSLDSHGDRLAVCRSFGCDGNIVSLRINRANLEGEENVHAFLRGAFLSCGSVVDPGKNYHMEFFTTHLNLSRDLECLLREQDLRPRTVRRKGGYVVYFKDSGSIEDLLTMMGAMHQTLELMNVKIYKDLRNNVNRVTNCETANLDKTVNASTAQAERIHALIGDKGLDALPDDLREIAVLRMENPDMSLRELGQALTPPLSRSGANHRLQRLMRLAGGG